MNLATERGFREATKWTKDQLNRLQDGGVWLIPRSFSTIRVVSHSKLEAEVTGMQREAAVVGIMRSLGWQCKDMDGVK